jgi:polyvinyl alcohol dehydrogenase (cytochrome)
MPADRTGRRPPRRPRHRARRGRGLGVTLLLAAALAACGDDTSDPAGAGDDGTPARATEWPTVGADLANTRAVAGTEVGSDDAPTLAPAWELTGVLGVTGTPVVDDGVVYVGDWTGHVRALDATTGNEVWAHGLDSGYVGGSLALDDEHAYVGTFDARVVALERDTGAPVWEAEADPLPKAVVFGSPVVADDLVVTGVGSFEVFVPDDPPTFRGTVVAFDRATGDEAWRFHVTDEAAGEGAGVSVWSSPAVDLDRGVLYIGTGQAYSQPAPARSDSLVALDIATGEEVWHRQFTEGDTWSVAETGGQDADVGAIPNVFTVDGTDAVGVGDKAGVYRALDRDTGEVLWEAELTPGGLQGGVMASAAVAESVVHVASNDSSQDADLIALDADTGDERWRVGVGAHVTAPVTWADGVLYLADDSGRIAAYDAADGARLWSHDVAFPAAGGISVVDGTVYAGWGWWLSSAPPDADGGLIAFRPGGADTGRAVYGARCASCHGGSGEGSSGPALVDVADRLSAEQTAAIVRDGRGAMPGWDGTLSDADIDAVVAYVRDGLGTDGG